MGYKDAFSICSGKMVFVNLYAFTLLQNNRIESL